MISGEHLPQPLIRTDPDPAPRLRVHRRLNQAIPRVHPIDQIIRITPKRQTTDRAHDHPDHAGLRRQLKPDRTRLTQHVTAHRAPFVVALAMTTWYDQATLGLVAT